MTWRVDVSPDTRMRVLLGAMIWWERWAFNALHAVVAATGAAYLYMKLVLTTDDPFALVNHPWQPAMLSIHVAAAPFFIVFFGMLFRSHTLRKLLSPSRFNRRSGWTSLLGFAVMAVSGYLIQVAPTPALVDASVWVHVLSSLLFVIGYGVHLAVGWRVGVAEPIVPRRRASGVGLGALLCLLAASAAAAPPPVRVERTVFLMGTMATFVAETADRETALAKLERMVRVIEETEAALSTWRDDSVLSALNRHPPGRAFVLPADVCGLLGRAARWSAATGGAFDPAVGSLVEAWGLREEGRQPDEAALASARAAAGFRLLALDLDACAMTRRAAVTLDAGGFGKGEALDRVREAERARPGAWFIDFGGQIAVSGEASDGPWTVALAHPGRRRAAVLDLSVAAGSIATSGGSERDLVLEDGVRIGHVLDPRSGRPVSRPGSVSVWHESAFAADVLSTALYVMGPEEGMAWAAARGVAACFLAAGPGSGGVTFRATPAFEARFPPPALP